MIGFATFFYKWFDFQNRIMITLTSLLVLSTLFSEVNDSLPATSYLKLIDIWFLISIIYCFSIIMTHVLVEYYHEYSNPTEIAIRKLESVLLKTAPRKVEPQPNQSSEMMKMKQAGVEGLPAGLLDNNEVFGFRKTVLRDPYAKPKMIDRWAFRLTVITYVIFLVAFWTIAITEKVTESRKIMKNDYDPIAGYPQ